MLRFDWKFKRLGKLGNSMQFMGTCKIKMEVIFSVRCKNSSSFTCKSSKLKLEVNLLTQRDVEFYAKHYSVTNRMYFWLMY